MIDRSKYKFTDFEKYDLIDISNKSKFRNHSKKKPLVIANHFTFANSSTNSDSLERKKKINQIYKNPKIRKHPNQSDILKNPIKQEKTDELQNLKLLQSTSLKFYKLSVSEKSLNTNEKNTTSRGNCFENMGKIVNEVLSKKNLSYNSLMNGDYLSSLSKPQRKSFRRNILNINDLKINEYNENPIIMKGYYSKLNDDRVDYIYTKEVLPRIYKFDQIKERKKYLISYKN